MEPATHLAALDQQLQLWTRLAEAIGRSQSSLLRGDLREFERATQEQAECCRRYRMLESRSNGASEHEPQEFADLRGQIEFVRHKVCHLNRVHAELLRRASRSLVILRNLLSSQETVYAPPAPRRYVPTSPERE